MTRMSVELGPLYQRLLKVHPHRGDAANCIRRLVREYLGIVEGMDSDEKMAATEKVEDDKND